MSKIELGFSRVTQAKRPLLGVTTNAASSLGNFLLAVGVARSVSVEEFGHFAVAFSLYVLIVGAYRCAITEQVLALPGAPGVTHRGSQLLVMLGGIAGVVAVGTALAFDLKYILVLGIALPGLVMYEHIKTLLLGFGRAESAFVQEIIWTGIVVSLFVLMMVTDLGPLAIFSGWAIGGATIGLLQAVRLGVSLKPATKTPDLPAKTSFLYGLEFLTGSGVAQLITSLLLIAATAEVIGALRAAGTILAPCTILITTARGIAIPYLARIQANDPQKLVQRALLICATMMSAIATLGLLVFLLPAQVGSSLLGGSWAGAKPTVPFLTAELVFACLSAIALALHRTMGAPARGLMIEAAVGPFRVAAILASAHYFGAVGASVAMALISLLGAALWWLSFTKLKHASVIP
ncbi:hypothetical protein [Actinoplanes sp. NPDC051494]|uniref:hypothetical protein n=1 Tax=Actinoplanes sp. NPDC051494 TaxID=3363907 RepID=UPI0037995B8D